MFYICEDVDVVGFPVQNVYKMAYGDENATFEPLNPWTVTSIETIVLKFQKVLLGPSLQYSITPIITNVLWTTDDPIDKETQFKAVHSIQFTPRYIAAGDQIDPNA